MRLSSFGIVIFGLKASALVLILAGCDGAPKPLGLKGLTADGTAADCSDAAATLGLASDADALYTGKVKTTLDGKCAYAGCHVAGAQAPDLSTYASAKTAGADIIQRAVTDKNMPPVDGATGGAIDDTTRDLLQTWATKGFPESLTAASGAATTAAAPTVTYADIAKLMKDKTCDTCHSTAGHQSGVILDTEEGYKAKAARIPEKLKTAHVGISFDATQLKLTADYAAAVAAAAAAAVTPAATPAADAAAPAAATKCSASDKAGGSADGTGVAADNSDYSKALSPPKLTECHDKGVIYDRRTKDCHVATLASNYACDWDGVKGVFKDIASADVLQKLQDDKWQVDQCGQEAAGPIVFLLQTDTAGGFLNVAIKVLSVE